MKHRNWYLTAGLLTSALALVPVTGQAVVTTTCAMTDSCLLSELLAGDTITIDDKRFENFTAFSSTAVNSSSVAPLNSGVPVQPDNIRVFSQADELGALGVPGEVGLAFNFGIGNPSQIILLDGAQTMAIHWEYDVVVLDPSLRIVDNTLLFPSGIHDGAAIANLVDTGEGTLQVIEQLPDLKIRKIIAADDNASRIEDHRDFAPVSMLHVVTDITGNGGPDATGTNVSLDWVVQSFSQQVPEPGTLALLAIGVAGLGVGARCHRPAGVEIG